MKSKLIVIGVLSVLFLISGVVLGPAQMTTVGNVLAQDSGAGEVLAPASPLAANFIMRIAGSAMRPNNSSMEYSTDGGCISATNNPEYLLSVPITLGSGATIDRVRMYYIDSSDQNSTGSLTIYNSSTGMVENEWSTQSAGNSGIPNYAETPLIGEVIDFQNNPYTYMLNWKPYQAGTSMRLCSWMVIYKPAPFGFLPVIRK